MFRVLFVVVCTAGILGLFAFMCPQQALTIDSGEVKGDVLVVLGGEMGRADRAAQLYRNGAAPQVIVTGFGDTKANQLALEKGGVPVGNIIVEPKALSTLENAEFTIPILRKLGAHRVIIVTSWYHSRRGLACFEHFAPDLRFFSRPSYLNYRPRTWSLESLNNPVNFEYLKLPGYWLGYGVPPW